MPDVDDDLVALYVEETGHDPNVIRRYLEAGKEPPTLESWLTNGVPTRDREIFKPRAVQEEVE